MSEMQELMEKLKREVTEGGELKELPCPFCQKPRSQRSDYIRCQSCGINWLAEEMHLMFKGKPYLEVNPPVARREAALTAKPIRRSATQLAEDAEAEKLIF